MSRYVKNYFNNLHKMSKLQMRNCVFRKHKLLRMTNFHQLCILVKA